MSTRFRLCHENDLCIVQSFVDQLYSSDSKTLDVHADISLTYRELSQKPDKGAIFVFELNETLIGYCIVIHFWSNEYKGNILEIDEIFIDKNYRRLGITFQLFSYLELEFADKIVGCALQVSEENKAAMGVVEKLGFSVSRNRHLIKMLTNKRADK